MSLPMSGMTGKHSATPSAFGGALQKLTVFDATLNPRNS
jgi:hypothetical protein